MMQILQSLLPRIIESIESLDYWDSLIINRRKPITYRIFRQFGDYRVCLHRFSPCDEGEAFLHPHAWPAAFLILRGEYLQKIALSPNLVEDPVDVCDMIFRSSSMYAITNPCIWHSIQPLKTTYSLMVNGPPWAVAHNEVRTTKGKDLEKMEANDIEVEMGRFLKYLREFREKHA